MATGRHLKAYVVNIGGILLLCRSRNQEDHVLSEVAHVVANIGIEADGIRLHLGAVSGILQTNGIDNLERREVFHIGDNANVEVVHNGGIRQSIWSSGIEYHLILADAVNLECRQDSIVVVAVSLSAGVSQLLHGEHVAEISLVHNVRKRKFAIAYTGRIVCAYSPAGERCGCRYKGFRAELLNRHRITFRAERGSERIVGANLIT